MKTHHDQIWTYLHGELPEQEKKLFEQALETDHVLAQALEERKTTNALLHETTTETNQENLVDALLAKWESEHPEFRERPTFSREKFIKRGIPLATAAAAAFVLFSAPWRTGAIHWEKTLYGDGPQIRGQNDTQADYSRADLKRVTKMLQSSVEDKISGQRADIGKWNFQLCLQEVHGGILLVELKGHPANSPTAPRIWETDFQSSETLQERASEWAQKISADLADARAP